MADLTREHDVVVFGGASVVHAFAAADAVDEYRLLVIPTALGAGERLFVAPVDLQLTSIETAGQVVVATVTILQRAAREIVILLGESLFVPLRALSGALRVKNPTERPLF